MLELTESFFERIVKQLLEAKNSGLKVSVNPKDLKLK